MTLRDELEPFASSGREASRIIEDFLNAVEAALRRDPRFVGISQFDFDLRLADVRADFERRLFKELHNRVHLGAVDIVDGVEP